MTKVKYLRGQMLRFIRRISLGRKVLPLYNGVLVHHCIYLPSFDHHIFSEGWLQFWSGRVRFLFLAIDGITLRWSEQAFDLCRGVYFELRLWNSWPGIWLHELLQLNQQTSSQNTQRWYLEAGENKHGSLKFHRKINLNIMAKTEQNLS